MSRCQHNCAWMCGGCVNTNITVWVGRRINITNNTIQLWVGGWVVRGGTMLKSVPCFSKDVCHITNTWNLHKLLCRSVYTLFSYHVLISSLHYYYYLVQKPVLQNLLLNTLRILSSTLFTTYVSDPYIGTSRKKCNIIKLWI